MKKYSLHGICCSNVNCSHLYITPSVLISVLFPIFLLLSNLSPCKSKLRKPSQIRVAVGRKGLGLQGRMCGRRMGTLCSGIQMAVPWSGPASELSCHSQRPRALHWDPHRMSLCFFFPLSYSWRSGRNGTCLFPFQANKTQLSSLDSVHVQPMQRHKNQCALILKLEIHKLL